MKATLRLMIAAAILVSAQMSFAATDKGAVKPPCPFANKSGGLVKTNFEPAPRPVLNTGSGQSAT